MSIQAVAWVLENSQSKGSARLILISLANYASEGNDWCAWPAMRTLAKEAGVSSPSTVSAAIDTLERLGELQVISRGDARHSGRYRLTFMERPDTEHSVQSPNAASSPGRTQRPVQGEQNRKEPEENLREPSPRRKPKTPMPSPFIVTEDMKRWVAKNFPSLDWYSATAQWVDALRSNDTQHRDWVRAWQTGMRRHVQWYGDGTQNSRTPARAHL